MIEIIYYLFLIITEGIAMSDIETLQATRNLVIRLTGQLDELKSKRKEYNEMYKNLFVNDESLKQLDTQLQTVNKQVKDRKLAINRTGEALNLKAKINDITEDVKMVEESLSTHLVNLYTLTNSTSFDVSATEEREYVIKGKVKGKPKSKKNAPVKGQKDIFGGEIE